MAHLALFDTTLHKIYAMLRYIEEMFGWGDRPEMALSALTAVLHTIRDEMSIEDAAAFGNALTPLAAGIFYEGWRPMEKTISYGREDFLDRVARRFAGPAEGGPLALTHVVLSAIDSVIDDRATRRMRAYVPIDARQLAAALPKSPEKYFTY